MKFLITESCFVLNAFVWCFAEYKLLTFESITTELVKFQNSREICREEKVMFTVLKG